MRGKLRDKYATNKRANFNNEELEQRRPYKRDSRTTVWSNNEEDADDELVNENEESIPEKVELPKKK